MNAETKLERIEQMLKEILEKVNKSSEWVTISEAAGCFAVHHSHIRNLISKAQANPNLSPLKYGIHYRKIGAKYQCNLRELEKAFNLPPT